MTDDAAERPQASVTEVAVGVLLQPDGRYLLAQRPQESRTKAIGSFRAARSKRARASKRRWRRELHEELGIDVTACERWQTLEHDYPHAYVRLYFCKVTQWSGSRRPRRPGVRLAALPVDVAPLLPAAIPVLEWLAAECRT